MLHIPAKSTAVAVLPTSGRGKNPTDKASRNLLVQWIILGLVKDLKKVGKVQSFLVKRGSYAGSKRDVPWRDRWVTISLVNCAWEKPLSNFSQLFF